MNWLKSKIFKSFGVEGSLIENLSTSNQKYFERGSLQNPNHKHLILYDQQEIKSYAISINKDNEIELSMQDKLQLYTKIKKIVYFQSNAVQYFIVQNFMGCISAISPHYPYEHKLVHLPEHFNPLKCTLIGANNKGYFIVQHDHEICIFESGNRQELIHVILELDVKKYQTKEIAQVEMTTEGVIHFLAYAYDINQYTTLITKQGFQYTKVGVKSLLFQCKDFKKVRPTLLHQVSNPDLNSTLTILGFIALEQDQLILLTNKKLYITKLGLQDCSISFQYDVPDSAFIRFVQNLNYQTNVQQVLVCFHQTIEIYNLIYDDFMQVSSICLYQTVTVTAVLTDVITSNVQDKGRHQTLLWVQMETGSCYLNILSQKQRQLSTDLEPLVKKVKQEEPDMSVKVVASFQIFKSIFNFTIASNHLFILAGNQRSQQIYKVQHEIYPIISESTVKLSKQLSDQSRVLFFETHIGFCSEKEQMLFYKVNKEFGLQLVDTITIPSEAITASGCMDQNYFYVQFESILLVINTNPLSSIQISNPIKNFRQQANHFIGMHNEDVVYFQIDFAQRQLRTTNLSALLNEPIQLYDVCSYRNHGLIMLATPNSLQIIPVDAQVKLASRFSTQEFLNNVCSLQNRSVGSQILTSFTCPSINMTSNIPLKQELEPLLDIQLISFQKSDSLIVLLVTQQNRVALYSLVKNEEQSLNLFKMFYSYSLNKPFDYLKKYQFYQNSLSQTFIPQLALALTDNLGEVFLHFIKQDSDMFRSVINNGLNCSFITHRHTCLLLQQFKPFNLPANNVIVQLFNLPAQKFKEIILINCLTINNCEFILVASKTMSQRNLRQFKNEILIYKHDNLQEPFTEFSEIDNEEIIKVAFMQTYELILIMTLIQPNSATEQAQTKVHILRIDFAYMKIQLLEYKTIRESVPVDIAILFPYSSILILTQDQIKIFDPPTKTRNSSIIQLSLQVGDQKQPVINYEAVATVDNWLVVLNGGFKIIVCKLQDDCKVIEAKWVVEFGVNSMERIWDISILRDGDKLVITMLDSKENIHIYQLSKEKNKLKKLADCSVKNATRLATVSEKFLISTSEGQMYLIQQMDDQNDQKLQLYDQVLEELPYVGGFHPANLLYANHLIGHRRSTKGAVVETEMLQIFQQLSKPLQKALEMRSKVESGLEMMNYE